MTWRTAQHERDTLALKVRTRHENVDYSGHGTGERSTERKINLGPALDAYPSLV